MKTYYLAIDIGASSGRHILGWMEKGKLQTEEIYRFENNLINQDGSLFVDIDLLFENVKEGLKRAKELKKVPKTIAIDTWGVDYVLLDKNKKEIRPCFSYRDSRTAPVLNEVFDLVSEKEMYEKTGIQKQSFNTVFQLFCDKKAGRLEKAEHFLMIPEYLSFKLTGKIMHEYTNATTTGLLNAKKKTWDMDIINKLGLKNELFSELSLPGDTVGRFSPEIEKKLGFSSTVVFAPSHDTASAVCATPKGENDLFVSCGTWALSGIETKDPIINEEARMANFTNEGGVDFRFRFLKNYMGMWLFQNIRRNLNKALTYDEMMTLAKSSKDFAFIDVNSPDFVAPKDMIDAIKNNIGDKSLTLSFVLNSVYHSLAKSFDDAIKEIESITQRKIDAIRFVGGGSKDSYLLSLTEKYTKKPVFAALTEATAIGNIITQIMADENISLQDARKIVKNSF